MNKNQGVCKDVQTLQFLEKKPQNSQKQNLNLKVDLNRNLQKMPIDDKYKAVLEPDTDSLVAYLKHKKKKEKAIQKLIDLKKIQIVKESKQSIDKSLPFGIHETDEGKLKDIFGKNIRLNDKEKYLKINQEKQKHEQIQDMLKIQNNLKVALDDKGRFQDKNLKLKNSNARRQKRKLLAFNFIENGKKEKVEENQIQIEDQNNENILEKNVQKLTTATNQINFKRVCVKMKHHDPIPNIEWWDMPLFQEYQVNYIPQNFNNDQVYMQPVTAHTQEEIQKNLIIIQSIEFTDTTILLEKITKLLEHPKPFIISEIVQNREKAALPSFLTNKERKKRLRKIRMDIQKEKQDKIRLGLQKPSPPRITLQNMMANLGAEAQIDPSMTEQEVRRQIQARLDKHLKQNKERKLTKEQRGDKLKQQWQKDASQEIRVAVFRIDEDLSSIDEESKKLKFKVDVNAQQLSLKGVCLIANQNGKQVVPSILVVEGGPKGIKSYKKLLQNRIKWRREDTKTGCTLIWEGVAKQHAFNKWNTIKIQNEVQGKRILAEKGVEQFWDLAMKNQLN